MPGVVAVGATTPAYATESNVNGNVPVVPANLSWTVSDTTIATFVTNADGSVVFTGVANGTVTVTVTDAAFNLVGSDTLDVGTGTSGPGVPTAIQINWGTAPLSARIPAGKG